MPASCSGALDVAWPFARGTALKASSSVRYLRSPQRLRVIESPSRVIETTLGLYALLGVSTPDLTRSQDAVLVPGR